LGAVKAAAVELAGLGEAEMAGLAGLVDMG